MSIETENLIRCLERLWVHGRPLPTVLLLRSPALCLKEKLKPCQMLKGVRSSGRRKKHSENSPLWHLSCIQTSTSPTLKKNTQVCKMALKLFPFSDFVPVSDSNTFFLPYCIYDLKGNKKALTCISVSLIVSTDWSTRVKQIAKLWRKASSQDRAPYVVRKLGLWLFVIFLFSVQICHVINKSQFLVLKD